MCDTEDGYKNVSKNHVVRFNLSVNDATRKNGQGVFMTVSYTHLPFPNNLFAGRC